MEHTAPTLLPLDGQDWRSPTFTERLQPQRRGVQTYGAGFQLSLLEQIYLVFSDVFLGETIGSLSKMASEVFNDTQIATNCGRRVITPLEFLQHSLS